MKRKENIAMCRTYAATLFLGMLLFGSCTKDPWIYDTSRKDGLIANNSRDTLRLTFDKFNDSTWTSWTSSYKLLGMPKDYDRTCPTVVIDSGTNIPYEDFHVGEVTLGANAIGAGITIWAKRPSADQENGECHFQFCLGENDELMPLGKHDVFVKIFVEHPEEPKWWNTSIFGAFSETSYKAYFKYYRRLPQDYPYEWDAYFLKTYGSDMNLMNNATKWTGAYKMFLEQLKKCALVPMFDYYTEHPHPDVEIPAWYGEWEK